MIGIPILRKTAKELADILNLNEREAYNLLDVQYSHMTDAPKIDLEKLDKKLQVPKNMSTEEFVGQEFGPKALTFIKTLI